MVQRFLVGLFCVLPWSAAAAAPEPVTGVDRQPLVAATRRLVETLEYVGAPLPEPDRQALDLAGRMADDRAAVITIQKLLDPYCLAVVTINPESRVSVTDGPAKPELIQQGWQTFLVKVQNEAGITPTLKVTSPQAQPVFEQGRGARQRPQAEADLVSANEARDRFLDIAAVDKPPQKPRLSGLAVEYRVLQLYSRDAGKREATLAFDVGQGTQDLGFRSELPILFTCHPATGIRFGVYDEHGQPTTAAFVIRDTQGRIYPNPARRLSPDFFFHEQVYRPHGESVFLPPGEYSITVSRGPEYLPRTGRLVVSGDEKTRLAEYRLTRWIDPKQWNWYSGDHHVHAAGCKHYGSPTEGVGPEAMMRHIVGEDLTVGCVLSWGPCWYTQKQYFEGDASALSLPGQHLMRYDVEVSGFPSSHAGHLCLLQLSEDDYPGTSLIEEWPSWTLPVLKWGKEQGGVVGYSHSGWGLALPDYGPGGERLQPLSDPNRPASTRRAADTLPDYAMPPFDGIGANEYIVAVAHGLCDFISAVDTPAIWELNIWYHTLNCGQRCVISGETDFPCIYGERVGLGRVYVQLDDDEELTYAAWARWLKRGRSYCGDGKSHLLDFRITDPVSEFSVALGQQASNANEVLPGHDNINAHWSQIDLKQPGSVEVAFDVAALLAETPTPATERIRNSRLDEKPYWHIERCRIGQSRTVPVEVIVNGKVVRSVEIEADGSVTRHRMEIPIERSSWVAIRILPSLHSNPIYVIVDGKPIRASRRSAEWCRQSVDVCWNSKQGQIRDSERAAARAAYDAAAAIYEQAITQSEVE